MNYSNRQDLSIVQEKKSIVIERELDRLISERGPVSAQTIVDAATPEESPLHQYFEWNNDEAARKYRLTQAYAMLLASKFVVERQNSTVGVPQLSKEFVRKFLPCHDEAHGFSTRPEILANDETRKSVVDRKIQVLRSWCSSVVDIQELEGVRKGVLKLLK